MENKKRAEFLVKGHVQGVGFRYFVQRNAEALNLSGYAKNLYNGDVEVIAEGEEDSIDQLYQQLKTGPSRSRVEKVQKNLNVYKGEFNTFSTG